MSIYPLVEKQGRKLDKQPEHEKRLLGGGNPNGGTNDTHKGSQSADAML
jgi:hypothetical protein